MSKKQLIAIVAVIGVVVVGVVGYSIGKSMIIKGDPFNYLFYSMMNNKYNAVEARIEANLEVDEAALQSTMYYFTANPEAMSKFVASVLNDVNISGDVKWAFNENDKSLFFDENIHLNYADKQMLSFGVGYMDQQLSLSSQTLTDKKMVLSKQDFFDLIRESSDANLAEVNFDKYLEVFDFENDPLYEAFSRDIKGYEEILRDKLINLKKGETTNVTLSDGQSIKCDTIELEMTMDEMTALYIALLNEAKYDVALKTLVKSKMIEILSLMKSSEDYKLMGISESEIDTALVELDQNFDQGWEQALDEVTRTYQEMQYELQKTQVEPFLYKIKVAIDSKYNVRMVNYTANLMGIAMSQTIYYDNYNSKVNIPSTIDEEKTISVKRMMEDEAFAIETATKLMEESINNFMDGEALAYFMSDIEEKSSVLPEDEANAIIEMVRYFHDNKTMIKNMLLESLGI